jgi:hypothetical protein
MRLCQAQLRGKQERPARATQEMVWVISEWDDAALNLDTLFNAVVAENGLGKVRRTLCARQRVVLQR